MAKTPRTARANAAADMAHPARVYDYWLGGKDNFAVDRALADQVRRQLPLIVETSRANRAFLGRAVSHLAQQGIRQFVDIGAGFPTMANTNEVVHAIAPESKVLFVDNDPVVLAHGRAHLAGRDGGRTVIMRGDVRDPGRIFGDTQLRAAIDLDRPVAVILVALLHFVLDSEDPVGIVRRIGEHLAPGSRLVLSHATYDFDLKVLAAARAYDGASAPFVPRSRARIDELFAGFELPEPGLVELPGWRPDTAVPVSGPHLSVYAGIGCKS